MEVRDALAVVSEGRAYTRENFPMGSPDKYVGHHPANDFYAAVDVLVDWVTAEIGVVDRVVPRMPPPISDHGGHHDLRQPNQDAPRRPAHDQNVVCRLRTGQDPGWVAPHAPTSTTASPRSSSSPTASNC